MEHQFYRQYGLLAWLKSLFGIVLLLKISFFNIVTFHLGSAVRKNSFLKANVPNESSFCFEYQHILKASSNKTMLMSLPP